MSGVGWVKENGRRKKGREREVDSFAEKEEEAGN